jgi:hypothetical protein
MVVKGGFFYFVVCGSFLTCKEKTLTLVDGTEVWNT